MPVVNGYCTLAELRTWMGDTGTILPAELLEGAINATSRMIDGYCGRRFWKDPAPTTRDFRVRDSDIVWVSDIADRTSLTIQTDDFGDGSFATTWTSSDYDLSPYNYEDDPATPHAFYRIHALTRSFPVNNIRRTLRVTTPFGWSAIPDPVHQACLMKSNMLVLRKDSPYGIAGFSEFGVVRINRTEDPEVTRLLAPFIRSEVVTI